jgi:hypothetical protein
MKALNLDTLNLFLNNQTGSTPIGIKLSLVAAKNALVLREYTADGVTQHILAAKVNGKTIGNSSRLSLLWQNKDLLSDAEILNIQLEVSKKVSMIPFVVIKQAGLELSTYSEIDKGKDETISELKEFNGTLSKFNDLKEQSNITIQGEPVFKDAWNGTKMAEASYLESRHFTGARLFNCSGKVFLMDVDRIELKHGIINPFLVEIPDVSVKTIAEAYESLKPQLVKDAEAMGVEVLRQGEWFLIKSHDLASVEPINPTQGFLRVGHNRPNRAEKYFEMNQKHFVSGSLSHTGREHKTILLDGWYQAVPNTSSNSFQISGDID